MFGWEFPPHNSGGLGTACLGITRALAKRGIKVYFVLPKRVSVTSDSAEIIFADVPNVSINRLDSLVYPYITSDSYEAELKKVGSGLYGLGLVDEVKLYGLRAAELAKNFDFDVIHAHDWLSFSAGLAAKKVSGKPLLAHVHATEFDRTGGNGINQEVYRLEKEGMEKADKVLAISHLTKKIIIDHYGIPAKKISVVHNGIEAEEFEPLPEVLADLKAIGKKIVLFVGRITLQKGPDYFINVAKRICELRDDIIFVVAGSGDMERQIIRQVAALGISDRVIFAGFLRGQELTRLYRAADLYVLPSVSEPFGLTPLESLCNGTPVLVSKQSGVAEVLNHALKVDFWDVDEMANKIIAVVDHPSLKQTLSQCGQAEAKNLSWHRSVDGYLKLYQALINQA